MNDAERDVLERAADFLWPHYTDAMPKVDYAAQSPQCQRLARALTEYGDQRIIDALDAPPEADVMVRAHRAIAEHVAGNPDGTMWWVTGTFVETVAGLRSSFIRELTEYGDQRACEAYRQARADLRADGFCVVCGVYHRVGGCTALENARREARAAAIEEVAQAVEKYSPGTGHVVRALANAA